ncbi:phosphate-starvation-inducible PsiE family protein [Egbenema bharatensis]|uniref:phosphate-starvation-inducible PsiE family protein n=1 Tax=Egbenema bharatensis TaxID=3463334 RepID=UPI003A87C567
MGVWRKLSRFFTSTSNDEVFLSYVKLVEILVSKVLSIAMLVVLLVSIVDLLIFLFREITTAPYGLFTVTLFEVFGLFLNILVALEVLENITAYLRRHVVQVELVVVTSLTAVARKIVIFDFAKSTWQQLIALGLAILTLSISYWLVRRTNKRYE